MALDLGRRRCGIAVTDSMQIVANGLAVVAPAELETFLKNYFSRETVDTMVIGEPRNLRGEPSDCTPFIEPIVNRLRKVFPQIKFERLDERFTSTLAHRAMIEAGMRRSRRQQKENADIMAATILLNDYLESIKNK